jgi:transcription elongation factor GreA-like protein/transcription elongation GreA/GreB family factor
MGYLKEFKTQIETRNSQKMSVLWEEYVTNDVVEPKEFITLLEMIKESDFATNCLGKSIELGLPHFELIQDEEVAFEVFRLFIDIQTSENPILAEKGYQLLEKKFNSKKTFQDFLKLCGLKGRDSFRGSLSNYVLLDHLVPKNFVFHKSGWGTGEILEVSFVREAVSIEFENVQSVKTLSFENAFKTLKPLKKTHFLARRFGDPDTLESQGKEDPVALVELVLKDLGPKTAAELKDELCELVIPEADWARWWQLARSKLKRHPLIDAPETLKAPFVLRDEAMTHEERLKTALKKIVGTEETIQAIYQLLRDHPKILKDSDITETLHDKLTTLLQNPKLNDTEEFQILLLLEHILGREAQGKSLNVRVKEYKNVITLIEAIEVVALKRRAIGLVRDLREDWKEVFFQLFLSLPQVQLREYLLTELNQKETKSELLETIQKLIGKPLAYPDLFVWYFQKIISEKVEDLPFGNKEGQCVFFEAFLILYYELENNEQEKDLLKKMYGLIVNNRFHVVRQILEGTSLSYAKELLLLVSKCHTLSDSEKKNIHSLAAVHHPSLSQKKKEEGDLLDGRIIWTTEAGLKKVQERVKEIGTVEMMDVAREIEKARSYGDLRENSEYKFACERRSRLQNEMKTLSEQIGKARVITKGDTEPFKVSLGSIVEVLDSSGKKTSYTLLGPWDADVEANILSFQSRLAQSMLGCSVGDVFEFRETQYEIVGLKNLY